MPKESKPARTERQESVFDIAIEMLFLAFLFLVAVIFDRRVGIVFSLTKVTVIRIISIAILSIWAIKIMLKGEHKFVRTPLDYPILSYILCCTVAAITSVHVLTSFEGFYGRYEGLTTIYIFALVYFIITNFLKTKEQILRAIYTVIISAVCMSLYSVIQRMGLDPYAWGGVVTWQRVIGTIGQPNFLAAYVDMAFIIGLALLLNLKDIRWKGKFDWDAAYDIGVRLIMISVLFLIYTCIFYTQSRGGFMGLFGGMFLFFTLANRRLTINKWKELSVLAVLVVLMTGITSLNPDFSPFGRAAYEAGRVGEELGKNEEAIMQYSAALSRLETWKSAYKIAVNYPIFGIGEEVLKMVFPRYETNKFRFYEGFHVKQDRCHNEVCDMSVTRGSLTLAIYVWVLATFFFLGVKVVRGDYDPELKLLTAGFLGAGAAYLIQNQFSFGVVAMTTLLWAVIGFTAVIYVKPEPPPPVKSADISNMPWLYFAALLIVALYFSYLSTIQFNADLYFKDGKGLADIRRFDEAVKKFETSLRISPYEGGTWTHYGISVLNIGQVTQNRQLIDKALDIFAVAYKLDPYNADNFYIAGRLYYIISLSDASVLNNILDSEEKAIKIDPYYAEAYQLKGIVYERTGRNQEAADMYERTVEINPQLADAVAALSNIYVKMGKSGKVIEIFKKFLERYQNNPIFQENLAAIYVRNNQIKEATQIYENMVAVDPKNIAALTNLGLMSTRTGDLAKARESFEKVMLLDPKSVAAHNGLGFVYLHMGQKEKAREEFNQTLSVDPNNQYAKQMLGGIK